MSDFNLAKELTVIARDLSAGEDYAYGDMAHEAVRNNADDIKDWLENIIGLGQRINLALIADMESQSGSYGVEVEGMPLKPLKEALEKEISKTWGKDRVLNILVDMLADQKYIW